MSIPQTFIQELIARADVVEIVGRHVQLKKGGANFMGLCPFHGEKSPSFSVSPTKQFYHCFGCGKNGNVISFLMDHLGMTFLEAVNDLSQQYGLQVPEDNSSPQDRIRAAEERQRHVSLSDVLERAAEAYRKHLKESKKAVAYFKERGVSGEIAKRYGLGYAPEGWHTLASVFPNYDEPLLVESGLVILNTEAGDSERRYDRFRDRAMFPIRNIKGECVGFGGRVLGNDKPKYLNSPETPVFSKGRELYGLFEGRNSLREHGYALVTEGYMDVVALAQFGFPNAVATLGTACTADHLQKLFRFTDSVVFSFDGETAGRRAARKALDGVLAFADDVRSIKFLFLPAEHDPDSFIREFGKEAFADCVRKAVPLSRFLLDTARDGCELTAAEGRAHFSSRARPLWAALPDSALKRQLLGEIADQVQLASDDLIDLWGSTATASGSREGRATFQTRNESRADLASRIPMAMVPQSRLRGRPLPMTRADHATRLLLGNMATLELLSAEDHAMLCELPEPHGSLFVWLEGQLHEHGAQPWVALREGLRGRDHEQMAVRLMAAYEIGVDEEFDSTVTELRNLLDRMLVERLKFQETQAIEQSTSDPSALLRYREFQARRRQLEASLSHLRDHP